MPQSETTCEDRSEIWPVSVMPVASAVRLPSCLSHVASNTTQHAHRRAWIAESLSAALDDAVNFETRSEFNACFGETHPA
jgi:hypothetical protein